MPLGGEGGHERAEGWKEASGAEQHEVKVSTARRREETSASTKCQAS